MLDKKIYTVYMFMRRDGKFYVNYTEGEVFDEFQSHIRGEVESTRDYLPVLLVYVQKFNKLDDADKRVKSIRKMNRERKINLIKLGINTFIPEVRVADKVQILLHKEHGINGIRYIKENNPGIDYTVCFNPNCPKHCDNSFLILNKSSVEELPDKGRPIKNSTGLAGVIKYYRKISNQLEESTVNVSNQIEVNKNFNKK